MLPTPSTLAKVTMCSHTLCLGRVTIKIIINRMILILANIGEVSCVFIYILAIHGKSESCSTTNTNKIESKEERKPDKGINSNCGLVQD